MMLFLVLAVLMVAAGLPGSVSIARETPPTPVATPGWDSFVERSRATHGEEGRRAAQFLAAHRPPRDAGIAPKILDENLDYAMRARREFLWARDLAEEIFFNDVLPYAVLDEMRESWRPSMYERCRVIVEDARTASEAAQALNRELFNQINVHYNTGRKRPNQSPSESIAQGRATCTGLSIILVDACRSVGIPARVTGVASWHDKRGNHTWVEIWDDGWHFLGADEYDPNGLNHGWFVGDASKAVAGSVEHAVWATSWSRTGTHFPMVWNRADTSVPAVDVTARYARGSTRDADTDGSTIFVRLWDTRGGERIAGVVESIDAGGNACRVETRAKTADLNDMPAVRLARGDEAPLRVRHNGTVRTMVIPASDDGTRTVDLYWDELWLSEEEAESLIDKHWDLARGRIIRERKAELDNAAFEAGGHTLRFTERVFGEPPAGGSSLWISLHGGGGAPPEVNDQQWKNQARLYEPAEGIYVTPRAPSNTWNLWHRSEIDPLFDRLIETYVAARGVNPNRVYLLGYSAGGDGVYQLAPRMADRFAAASMMAGHPNETQPEGLRNLPFAIFMGGEDGAYNRNQTARDWQGKLADLANNDPAGYPHRVTIYEGLGHWMDGRDAEALPWMAGFERRGWPNTVVWRQDDVVHTRFYWLKLKPEHAKTRAVIRATVADQHFEIGTDDVSAVTLRLSDHLVDLDKPITVAVNGVTVFSGRVPRSEQAIETSLRERTDPATAATAELELSW